jgi:hypothetical protein
MRKTIISAALALGVAACGKAENEGDKKPAEPAPATTPAAGGETATAPGPAATAADAGAADPAATADPATPAEPDVAPEAAGATEVPTTEDFEEKATKDVGEKNLEQEVDKMEKELGVEPAKK